MPWLEPVSLSGPYARLEPLSQDQCEGLTEAVRDGELWKLWYTSIPSPEGMKAENMPVRVEENLTQREVSGDVAVPLALFAAEALTNIFKYAFPPGREGVIRVELIPIEGGNLRPCISDNGIVCGTISE